MPTELERWGARARYQAEFSEKYHVERSMQLLRWKLAIQYVAIASGLPAVSLLSQSLRSSASESLSLILGVAGVVVALLTILDQVYKFSDRATEHRLVSLQYTDIAKELRSKKLTESDLERIQSRMDGLQIVETINPQLEMKSHNAIMTAYDFGPEFYLERRRSKLGIWSKTTVAKAKKNIASDEETWVRKLGAEIAA